MTDALLDSIFSVRKETVRINWGAYPHYKAPEKFAPFILDGKHLYYVNAFENAASTMETSAVAAENIARLILSRFFACPARSLTDQTCGGWRLKMDFKHAGLDALKFFVGTDCAAEGLELFSIFSLNPDVLNA
ncbi:hypothetical protein OIU77_002768 [Salix suchowensis]|uniref:Prenylcysteine lyase domain-containing protein n=1 Tax=Salix suchowensis TaxID=1278906 RepID=A0ABQ9AYH7_9ROSI|nr:hypothetical protein OIU77_002768 [Salix suchowensis]